jgi:hypothetical protein
MLSSMDLKVPKSSRFNVHHNNVSHEQVISYSNMLKYNQLSLIETYNEK